MYILYYTVKPHALHMEKTTMERFQKRLKTGRLKRNNVLFIGQYPTYQRARDKFETLKRVKRERKQGRYPTTWAINEKIASEKEAEAEKNRKAWEARYGTQ